MRCPQSSHSGRTFILQVSQYRMVPVCTHRLTSRSGRFGVAIVGALGAAVGNLLHPVTPHDDPVDVARVIAESDAWTLIHVVIIFGLILMFLGLVAIRYSIEGGVAEALARLGVYAAAVGTTLGIATVILDGSRIRKPIRSFRVTENPASASASRIADRRPSRKNSKTSPSFATIAIPRPVANRRHGKTPARPQVQERRRTKLQDAMGSRGIGPSASAWCPP